MPSKFLNISNDNTLGGSTPSPEIIPSEKAISEYINQRVINATELVASLVADTDFQNWCDLQTPQIPYSGSSMTWSEDFVTVLSIYSRFIQDYGNSAAYWGTHIINDIDVSKKSGVICSVDIATQNRLGVVKGSTAYSPSGSYGRVAVAPDGTMYADTSNTSSSISATELVAALVADTDFQDWCDAQTPPIPYSGGSMTWTEDFVTILNVYSQFIHDYNNSISYWGVHIINDVDSSNKSGVISSVDIATQNRLGVVKGSAAYSSSGSYSQVVVAPDGSLYATAPPITVSHDFTFQTVTATAVTIVTFNPNQRNTILIRDPAYNISFTIYCNNAADNYIWVQNTGSTDIDIFINNVYYMGNQQTNIYLPSNGITVPIGQVGEIGIVSNSSGTYITCTYIEL